MPGDDEYAASFIGRLVGCVHQTHSASFTASPRSFLTVVLNGYEKRSIEADWSDDEADEFAVTKLG